MSGLKTGGAFDKILQPPSSGYQNSGQIQVNFSIGGFVKSVGSKVVGAAKSVGSSVVHAAKSVGSKIGSVARSVGSKVVRSAKAVGSAVVCAILLFLVFFYLFFFSLILVAMILVGEKIQFRVKEYWQGSQDGLGQHQQRSQEHRQED